MGRTWATPSSAPIPPAPPAGRGRRRARSRRSCVRGGDPRSTSPGASPAPPPLSRYSCPSTPLGAGRARLIETPESGHDRQTARPAWTAHAGRCRSSNPMLPSTMSTGNHDDDVGRRLPIVALGYDCFISHSHNDARTYALELRQKLEAAGVTTCLDDFEFQVGDALEPAMLNRVRSSSYV